MKLIIFSLISLFILGILAGFTGHILYEDLNNKRIYNGLWIPSNITQPEAIEKAKTFDSKGSWVCVNIKGMAIQDMVTTCEHEVSHEIFAQKCQNNASKCLEEIGVENESK